MLKVLKVNANDDYTLDIGLSDGIGTFNVKPYLLGVFQALKNKGYFSSVYATKYGIEWKNGQDFSSDTIIFDIKNQ